ncbi:uncharacterized protein LOC124147527 isoform X2 [Haliotis rufescens]|uniref:uncharacterized protein LOC124147527 isoform X2 n=1 Tax=Haliotis rufescens TaxID=6454 RepID=UPI00201E890F|nr:uncharacterized protein LOC124147527 isoform X2 [Haliotis rufescens]
MAGVRWLILTAAVSGWWIQLMLGTTCQDERFGDMCSYSCHCTPPCDQTTGVCNGACDPGWFGGNGQTCQRGNVAYNKTAKSSGTDYARNGWTADKVVDGNRDQDVLHNSCFHSHSRNSKATLTVDLGQQYRIHDVRIYNRADSILRIRTAVLSLSNYSSSTPGVTCFTFSSDTPQTPDSVYDVTCDGTGRYFTITHSTKLNLCEVEIYVCSNGRYGQNCSNACTDRKCAGDSPCDHVRGTCVSGCEPGWMGQDCIGACSEGSYGQNCSNACTKRKCAGDSPCDHVRGTCVSGCEPGWMGQDCTGACSEGSYGQNCSNACTQRKCAGDSPCDHVRGTCVSGCEPGWMGQDCIGVCSNGRYGQNCSNACTDRKCAGDSPCDHVRGTCVSGCEPGWMGQDCIGACSEGSYGQNCSNACTKRKCAGDSPCDHVRGTCVSGCEPGWMGQDCTGACSEGSYGQNCSNACTKRKCAGDSPCDHVRGTCVSGCEPGWMGQDCTGVHTQAPTSPSVPGAAVGGAVAGLVLLVLVLVLLLVIIRRRRNRGNKSPDGPEFGETSSRNRKLQGADNVYMNVGFEENDTVPKKKQILAIVDKDHGHQEHPREADTPSVANQEEDDKDAHVDIHPEGEAVPGDSECSYYNLSDLDHVIPLSSLEARVREIENHPQEAFERLPGGFTHSYGESQKAGNKGKNRFKGYYPYDFNRVVLHDDSDGSRGDYINASYLDGYKTDNRYIAAQGPYKSDIVEDFWRMIWQEGCTSIVMVTGLVEAGKVKCLQYWPSGKGPEKFGDVMVTVETETRLANCTITKLAVENEKGSERRDVYHLHFTSWPDHGVPDTAALLDFMWRVKVISGQQTEPIIVHCSAGIGRTGTYIAVESLVEQAKTEGVVDVVSFVSNMRGQRKNMIQTKEQYLFVYQAVARAVTEGDTSLDCDVIREMNLDHVSAIAMGNRTVQQHIKVLQSDLQDQPDDSLFKTVPSYTSRNGFVIMTSHPNKEEVWETLYNSDCRSIFTYPTHDQCYLPTAKTSVTTKRFEVTVCRSTPLSDNIILNTVEVKLKHSGEVTVMQHYQNTGSARDAELDLLIDSLLTWTNDLERVCSMIISDCMSECRLLVPLVNIASRLQDDGRVDVINNMRQLYTRLGGPPFTEADVRLCLEFTQRRLETRGVYANM